MTTAATQLRQLTASAGSIRPALRLIPPLAEESGFAATMTSWNVPQWALGGRYLLVDEVPACAHGPYLMTDCPAGCYGRYRDLDHVNLWVSAMEHCRPFLLSHPYADTISGETKVYAETHGLRLTGSYPKRGGYESPASWYGHGTLAVALTVAGNVIWPLQWEADGLLTALPVSWPE